MGFFKDLDDLKNRSNNLFEYNKRRLNLHISTLNEKFKFFENGKMDEENIQKFISSNMDAYGPNAKTQSSINIDIWETLQNMYDIEYFSDTTNNLEPLFIMIYHLFKLYTENKTHLVKYFMKDGSVFFRIIFESSKNNVGQSICSIYDSREYFKYSDIYEPSVHSAILHDMDVSFLSDYKLDFDIEKYKRMISKENKKSLNNIFSFLTKFFKK